MSFVDLNKYMSVADPGFSVGGGRQPPTRMLFGQNICRNERIGSCWGGAPWIRQCMLKSIHNPKGLHSSEAENPVRNFYNESGWPRRRVNSRHPTELIITTSRKCTHYTIYWREIRNCRFRKKNKTKS